jgi:hypothetical protein
VLVGQGRGMEEVLREIGVTANTYYRWRKEYGGLGLDQARLAAAKGTTFEACAKAYIEAHKASWKSDLYTVK